MVLDSIEQGLRTRNGIFKFAAQTQKQVKEIIRPIIEQICEDCPPSIKPYWHSQDGCYIFPSTNSRLGIAGTDGGHAEKLRGAALHRGYVDEAGQQKQLRYVLDDILLPQTLTTGGSIIVSSTPPDTPAHDFFRMCTKAKADGNYAEMNIFTNPRLTEELIHKYAQEVGGINSTTFQREYMCRFTTDANKAVIPNFEEYKDKIIFDNPRPEFFDTYESMDLGFKDLTVVLFAYWDFKKAKLILEDEIVMNGVGLTTDALAGKIKDKRKDLWKSKEPYIGVMDVDLILQNDLARTHKLYYRNANKEEKNTNLNHLILMLQNEEILINPRCTTLISHLEAGVWDKRRKDFERTEEFGHFDAIDALLYLSRAIDKQKNPYPPLHGMDLKNQGLTREEIAKLKQRTSSQTAQDLANVFGFNKKRGRK